MVIHLLSTAWPRDAPGHLPGCRPLSRARSVHPHQSCSAFSILTGPCTATVHCGWPRHSLTLLPRGLPVSTPAPSPPLPVHRPGLSRLAIHLRLFPNLTTSIPGLIFNLPPPLPPPPQPTSAATLVPAYSISSYHLDTDLGRNPRPLPSSPTPSLSPYQPPLGAPNSHAPTLPFHLRSLNSLQPSVQFSAPS